MRHYMGQWVRVWVCLAATCEGNTCARVCACRPGLACPHVHVLMLACVRACMSVCNNAYWHIRGHACTKMRFDVPCTWVHMHTHDTLTSATTT